MLYPERAEGFKEGFGSDPSFGTHPHGFGRRDPGLNDAGKGPRDDFATDGVRDVDAAVSGRKAEIDDVLEIVLDDFGPEAGAEEEGLVTRRTRGSKPHLSSSTHP